MPENEIQIRHVTVGELEAYASNIVAAANPGDFIPITLQRAYAMANNPFADPDDVALLTAYSGEQLVGYFGIMAVGLHDGQAQHKAHWFTTWMVSPKFLGRGVGSMLMQAALELEKDYFIVGSKPARRVCDKFGFERLPPYEFVVLDLGLAGRFNLVSLALRLLRKLVNLLGGTLDIHRPSQAAERFFEGLLGWLVRPLLSTFVRRKAAKGSADFRFEPVSKVRKPEGAGGAGDEKPRLARGVEAVNWMLAYPWVLPPGGSQTEDLDFYFSDTRSEIDIWAVEAHHDGYCGYAAFQFSLMRGRRVLKVLDVESRPGDGGFVLKAALQAAGQKRAQQIELAPEHAASLTGGWIDSLLLRRRRRIYQVHPRSADSSLAKVKDRLVLHYTDGDTPFT
ncbi:MAG: GNAT family N-acetyltransferase [Anaerolineae bacterium]|nr:GNAT family N-acetyltransferase [Anaerolineae bacterium]